MKRSLGIGVSRKSTSPNSIVLPYSPSLTSRSLMGRPRRLRFFEVEDPAPLGGGKMALIGRHISYVVSLEDWKKLTHSWG